MKVPNESEISKPRLRCALSAQLCSSSRCRSLMALAYACLCELWVYGIYGANDCAEHPTIPNVRKFHKLTPQRTIAIPNHHAIMFPPCLCSNHARALPILKVKKPTRK
mmetsp:Transcript_45095/g.98146  ORF Transcript_45095/g.98146 Transcript_45095/m.98146 type:complete len:108 (+) Transcript_45095:375-698(+)